MQEWIKVLFIYLYEDNMKWLKRLNNLLVPMIFGFKKCRIFIDTKIRKFYCWL